MKLTGKRFGRLFNEKGSVVSIDSSADFINRSESYAIDGMSYDEISEKKEDGARLLTLFVRFISFVDPNFLFRGIQDKKFIAGIKAIVKNRAMFDGFLKAADMNFREFVETMVYALPKVFTYQFIKFIQTEYLGIERK